LKGTIGDKMCSKLREELQNAKSPEEAAVAFARGYLRPAMPYLEKRIADFHRRGVPGVESYTGTPTGDVAADTGAPSPAGDARLTRSAIISSAAINADRRCSMQQRKLPKICRRDGRSRLI
jgi:hypothetical protein